MRGSSQQQLTILDPQRFANSRKLSSYLGLIPSEHSSGGKQRLLDYGPMIQSGSHVE